MRAAREAGAEVHLVAGPTALPTPRGGALDVQSARQMHDAVLAGLHGSDVFIAVAAVADWRPAQVAAQKLKKANDTDTPTLEFVQNPDILAAVARGPTRLLRGLRRREREHGDLRRAEAPAQARALLVGNIGHHTFGPTTTRSCCSTHKA